MKKLAKALMAAAVPAASGAASAVSIDAYTFNGSVANIFFNCTPESLAAGEIAVNSTMSTFATYSIELTQSLSIPNSTYSFGPYANDWISRLVAVSGFYGGADQASNQVDTIVEKTAFQLAIWEAVYDAFPGDLTTGIFGVTSADAGVVAQANSYLAASGLLPAGTYLTNLAAFTSPSGQDLVTAVPEPSTYAMLMGGLMCVGFAARRHSQSRR